MYQAFYHLKNDPFRLTPDPRFCYAHPSFARARSYMRYAIDQGEGFVMVTGRPGTGKTTLIEEFLSELSTERLATAKLLSTQLQAEELMHMVAHAFGLQCANADRVTVIRRIEKFLMDNARAGGRAVLIVDEAQLLSYSGLEALRLLTNLQLDSQAVLQIFLIGQEQLRPLVNSPNMEQLRQRILVATQLTPMDADQTGAYIEHRLRCAGWEGQPQFSERALMLIHAFSEGLPREVNKLCARLLLHGNLEEKFNLTADDVLSVARELRDEQLMPLDLDDAAGIGAELPDTPSALGHRDDQTAAAAAPTDESEIPVLTASEQPEPGASDHERSAPTVDADIRVPDAETGPAGAPRSKPRRLRYALALLVFAALLAVPSIWHSVGHRGDSRPPSQPPAGSGAQPPASPAAAPTARTAPEPSADAAPTPAAAGDAQVSADDRQAPHAPGTQPKPTAPPGNAVPATNAPAAEAPSPPAPKATRPDTPPAPEATRPDTPAAPKASRPETPTPPAGAASASSAAGPVKPAPPGTSATTAEAARAAAAMESGATRTAAAPSGSAPAAANAPGPTTTGDQGRIARLLIQAQTALDEYRLTIPTTDSAYYYYGQVLALRPHNAAAEQGLKEIVSRYRMLIRNAMDDGRYAHARELIARALRVRPDDPRLIRLRRRAGTMGGD
jgi:general secretion pathway protein A